MSEKQAEHTNAGIKDRDALTFKLRERSRTHDHTLIAAEGELRDLQQRLVHEESAVNSLKSAVTNAEVVPSELIDRLNTRVRLGALREQATRQIMGDVQNAVSGVRASEKYSESEQWRVYLGWAEDLATIEQQIAAQDAAVAHAEQKIKEEHAAMHQNLQMSEHGLLEELTQLSSERDRSWMHMLYILNYCVGMNVTYPADATDPGSSQYCELWRMRISHWLSSWAINGHLWNN